MSHIFRHFISSLSWSSKLLSPYGGNPSRKAEIEQLVFDHAKKKGVDARGAETAVIVYDKFFLISACIQILPATIYLGQPNTKGVPVRQLQIMSLLSSKMGKVNISLHTMLVFQNEGCRVSSIQVQPFLADSYTKLRLLTVRSVMMLVRNWLWLPIKDRSSSLLKKANTLFCQVEALSRSLVNSCSSLSPCESKFQAIDNAKDGTPLLSTVSPISLPHRFRQCCL